MFRRSPRAIALRAAAAAVGVVTAVVVASDLAALHRRAGDLGPQRVASIARRDLHVGDTIRRGDVATRRIHDSQLPPAAARAEVVGRVVAIPVLRGSFVASRNLAPRARTGLDGVVPAGMRAIRLTVSGLRPRVGASVDVLASFGSDLGGLAGGAPATVVVAAGVLVLGTDDRVAGGTARGDALGVTLLVSRPDAERLADAQANAILTLTLVPPEEASQSVPGPRARRQ